MQAVTIAVKGTSKRFGPTVALDDVSIEFRPGEVHALMGANGSGKSTLTKLLVGYHDEDAGQIAVNGAVLPRARRRVPDVAGIAAVFQETSLVPGMTVEDNIWLLHEPRRGFRVDRQALRQKTEKLIGILGNLAPEIRADVPVGELGPDARQLVEVLKALSWEPGCIILDEATASLDSRQAARIAELVRLWRVEGRSVILVTHRMHEAFALSDRISVLRNGRLMSTTARGELDEAEIVDLMVGSARAPRHEVAAARPKASADQCLQATVEISQPFSLSVGKGEIVGLGGLQGQGQARVLNGLFAGGPDVHSVSVDGAAVAIRHPADALRARIGLVPGDRNREGLLTGQSVQDNVMISSWRNVSRLCFANLGAARKSVASYVDMLRLKTASIQEPVSTLSGGNAQKVVLARWLATNPSYLLLNDPTKGIDVNARADFYEALRAAQDRGMGILIYSSDEHELAALCDRVMVLFEGRLIKTLSGDDLEAENIARAGVEGPGGGTE